MRTILIIVLLTVVLPAVLFAQEPEWSIEGKALTADNCPTGCPCIFGEQPTHGRCEYVAIMLIEKGNYGDVTLDNTRFALGGAFGRPKDQPSKQVYDFVAHYVDANAKENQKEALKKILVDILGKPAEFKELPIAVSGLDGFGHVGKTCQGTVGGIAKVEVTPISGYKNGQPIVVENSAEPLFNWTVLGKTSDSYYKGAGVDWKFEATSGESHKFSLKSSKPEAVKTTVKE